MESREDICFLEKRPGVMMVGSANVGKRTLLSRLLGVDFKDSSESSPEVLVHGWTINTKYYTVDLSVWMSHLCDGFAIGDLPIYHQLEALVLVFDVNDLSSFVALQAWVSETDIKKFDILLCIGNKVDLLPGHSAHAEYRRRMLRRMTSSSDQYSELPDYGISETEGNSLLGDGNLSQEISRRCLEWCTERHIEYIEACASNADFDKCLSVNGDSQGVERLYGALSAHMWPGMILKSGDKITEPSLPEPEESSDEETDYELEYEILSAGSAEPWDGVNEEWVSANGPSSTTRESDIQIAGGDERFRFNGNDEPGEATEPVSGSHFDLEELEQLMSEIGNTRESLRLMPDFQRREMAGKIAMKMAAMFGDGSDGEDGFEF